MAVQKLSAQLKKQLTRNALVESLEHETRDFRNDVKKQLQTNVKGAGSDLLSQLLGSESSPKAPQSGDLEPGKAVDLSTRAKNHETPKVERKTNISAAIEYHTEMARSSDRMNRKESHELQSQISEIMAELQRLVSSTDKVMQMQYADFSVGQAPVTPGKYHLNYFTFVLSVIRSARQKVEDSGAWLQVSKKKGGVLNDAWKKGNTSVTMSNERQVATQSG